MPKNVRSRARRSLSGVRSTHRRRKSSRRVGTEKDFRIRTRRGSIAGSLFLPRRKQLKDVGCVLFLHGRSDDRTKHWYPELYRRLMKRGMAVCAIELNGHGKSYGAFEDFTYTKGEKDVADALRWLQRKGARRIGVMGFSLGGGLAILAASRFPWLKAVVLVAPVALPKVVHEARLSAEEREFLASHSYVDIASRSGGTVLRMRKTFFAETARRPSFLNDAAKIHSPVLIVHGTKDRVVPLTHSKRLYRAIASETELKRLRVVLGATHVFPSQTDRRVLLAESSQFLAHYVGRDTIDIVKAAVTYRGELLLLKRSKEVAYDPLQWDMPSGHVDRGERPDAKVIEEVSEEAGFPKAYLRIRAKRVVRHFSKRHGMTFRIHLYHLASATKRVRLNWENVAATWVDPKRLPRKGLRSFTQSLLRELGIV